MEPQLTSSRDHQSSNHHHHHHHRSSTSSPSSQSNGVLTGNKKVMQFLQHGMPSSKPILSSPPPPSSSNFFSSLLANGGIRDARLHKTPSHTHDLFHATNSQNTKEQPTSPRARCYSDGSSSLETLYRSDYSSNGDPGLNDCTSSNASSSGICSSSEVDNGEEEDLDFSLGFDQIVDSDDGLEDLDENEEGEAEEEGNLSKNADAATLLGESNLDARISELEEYLRLEENGEIEDDGGSCYNNDDTITAGDDSRRSSFLSGSTYTLYSESFGTFTEGDDGEAHQVGSIGVRSNSLTIIRTHKPVYDKPPKKVVRFADVLGLDLESIRYMTPPDQSASSIIQECIRAKLEQLRLAKSLNAAPTSASPAPLTSTDSSSPITNLPRQLYLVPKNFSCPPIFPQIYDRKVLLECLYTKECVAYGTVRIHNCAYDKRVFVRATSDEWATCWDVQAWHSMNFPHDQTDTFIFELRIPTASSSSCSSQDDQQSSPQRLLFAVCLQIMLQEFWDNKQGWNYVLEVHERERQR